MRAVASETLIADDYTGEPPSKRLLAHIQKQRERNNRIVGVYCGPKGAPGVLVRGSEESRTGAERA